MFKTARMRKIRIVTLDKYIAPTVDALHAQGLVQISDISDSIQQDPELAELVTPSKATPYTGKLSSLLMKTNGISELLGNSLSEGHGIKDTLMSFISPDMPIQKKVEDFFSFCGDIDSTKIESSNGKSKAFILFKTKAATTTALMLNNSAFEGETIKVSSSSSRAQEQKVDEQVFTFL